MQRLLLALSGIVLALVCSRVAAAAEITILTGKVIPTVTRAAPLPFNAVVEEVLVKPGVAISAGAPLMRYRLQDEAERLLQREVTMGAGTEQLKGQILDMQRELGTITADRNKTRQLVSSGLGSRQALERLQDNVDALKNRIELTREIIRKNESNFKARLTELSGYYGQPIKEGARLPEVLVLTSPISGYVLSVAPGLYPGQLLMAGAAPIQVGQLDPVLVQVPVYEAEINSIHVGDSADVEIPSLDNRKFKGLVSEISWISNDMNVANPSYYNVELTVPNPELILKPGFKAIVRFEARSRRG